MCVDVQKEASVRAVIEIPKWWCVLMVYRKRPAYERYEYLAKEEPPALALPGKYQRLLTLFQGTDTVVSMLYNRQEIITFSKLQAAVQSMTRKWVHTTVRSAGEMGSTPLQKVKSKARSSMATTQMADNYVLGFAPTLRFLQSQSLCRFSKSPSDGTNILRWLVAKVHYLLNNLK